MSQSHFDKAVSCFSKAILLQSHQTEFYVQRAEAYLQLCDFQSAALDYKHAYSLEPQTEAYHQRLAFIYYLQGQCLFDLGKFLEALESFTKAAELKPSFQPYHMRSLACLTALGRYSDCLRLVNNWLEMDGQSADLFTLRARLNHQLSQMTSCYHDLSSALRLDPSCPEAQALLKRLKETAEDSHQAAVDKALKGELSDALGKINTALEYNPNKAQYYLFRGILYRRLKDFTAAIEDLVVAVEFCGVGEDPPQTDLQDNSEDLEENAQTQLVLTYNDFAIQCFSRGLYSEAIMLLNKAIEKQRDANCFFKQCEWTFALADYQQAEEMDPDNTAIWLRLAIIHNTLGLHSYEDKKYQEAADKFSVAIRVSQNPADVKDSNFQTSSLQSVKLNQAVKRALQQRQPLHYDGPRLAPVHPVHEEPSAQERPYVWRKFGGFGLNC
ncbi:tetratricopeptide repeat 16 isoform X1 [Labeo rohita]|uniref:Tetratricopeptide repeat 16 isoform X1 n=1 Tax=Labeo rohita TaxID=84645 RepID=A0A498MQL8_LABRO|nr:tetratricopeptide repeat 16 isoform X1 [Labeo rohita]